MDRSVATRLGPDDPEQVGSFRLVGVLGTGGMGRVYLGITEGGYVAVKRVLPSVADNPGFLARFRREVEILCRVPAGVAPRVLAHDSTARPPWFATEYVPGLTVEDAVRLCGPLPSAALWALLADAAEHLRVVHEAGIVHRDLKPSNVMLTRGGVVLIDFGIARAADQARLTRDGSGGGTHGFAAPELDAGDAPVTAAADVYSLGALLYCAATGKPPGRTPDPEPVRAVDRDLAAVVESCLDADPAARPTAAGLLDLVPDRALPAEAPWPSAVMDSIAERSDFAVTPMTKLTTVPPPSKEDVSAPKEDVPASAPIGGGRRHRNRRIIASAVLVTAGAVAALVLAPYASPSHTATQSSGQSLAGGKARTPSPPDSASAGASSSSPTPSASAGATKGAVRATPPASPGGGSRNGTPVTSHVGPTSTYASPTGPGSDSQAIEDSAVYAPGCAAWLDRPVLYGTVSASNASCQAHITYGSIAPGASDITAANYSESSNGGFYMYTNGTVITARICVWNVAYPAEKQCSATYTDTIGGSITKS